MLPAAARAAAAIAAVCPTVPAEVIASVPVPAPIVPPMSILPDVVVFSVTLPLLDAIPVTPPAEPTARLLAVSLNEKASPACVSDAATIPTVFAPFRVTAPIVLEAARAAAEIEPDSLIPPALALNTTVPAVAMDPPMPIVPADRVMLGPVTRPETERLPVSRSEKLPVVTAKEPTLPIALPVWVKVAEPAALPVRAAAAMVAV